MTQNQIGKHRFDLEERTFTFAKNCSGFIKKLPRNISNIEYGKQLARSSGSVAANYIEANEALSKKDFIMRIKICRKECKETRLWLKLSDLEDNKELSESCLKLINESLELSKIFNAIITKSV